MHLLDAYPGLDKCSVIQQEASWLDYQYKWSSVEIAGHLKVTEDEVKEWLKLRDRECKPEKVDEDYQYLDEEDIPF